MEYWFIRFYNIVIKYRKNNDSSPKRVYDRMLLSEEYKEWKANVLKDIEAKNAVELSELKDLVLLACDGYKTQFEKADASVHNFVSVFFGTFVAVVVYVAGSFDKAGLFGTCIMLVSVGVIAYVFICHYYKLYSSSAEKSSVQFLYYSELLRIINAVENEKQRYSNKQRCFREQRQNRQQRRSNPKYKYY